MKRHQLLRLPGAILIFLGFFLAGHETHDAIPHEHPWDTHVAYAAAGELFVSDLSPQLSGQTRLDADANGGTLVLGGVAHARGVGMAVEGNFASATLQRPAGCTGFAATIAHDNDSQGTSFRFRVMRLNPSFVEFSNDTIGRGSAPKTIALSLSAGEIILEGAGSGMGDWGSARFTGCPGGVTPTVSPTVSPTSPPATGYCTQALHDSYTTVGPDGRTYPTWHPQRDPSGCYFGHEHGSDPSLFNPSWHPAYGYVAIAAAFPEPHEGFKGYALPAFNGYRWYITHHFGTAGAGRVCTRFHEVQWAVTNVATGQLVAHLAFMGDYGRAENNDDQRQFHPTACPHQADDAINDESYAVRQIATISGTLDYEPWRIDGHKITSTLGFDPNDLVINTRDGVMICADMTCDQLVKNPDRADGVPRFGDDRFVTNNNLGAQFLGTKSGTFFTNAFGTASGGAFRQFVEAGLTARIPTTGSADDTLPHCRYLPDNRMPMACDSADNPVNIDRKLKSPN